MVHRLKTTSKTKFRIINQKYFTNCEENYRKLSNLIGMLGAICDFITGPCKYQQVCDRFIYAPVKWCWHKLCQQFENHLSNLFGTATFQ